MRKLRVLVACEMSGRVRTAFTKRDWDAWSADLLPDEAEMWSAPIRGPMLGTHYQGDVLDIIEDNWDLVIAHPPCTDLSQAGARYWKQKQADGRQQVAIEFFERMYYYPNKNAFVVVENPRGIMSNPEIFRAPDQIVEPWWFGDPLSKKTCLWYREAMSDPYGFSRGKLPLLVPDRIVKSEGRVTTGGGSWRTDKANGLTGMNKSWEDSQGRNRRHILRSITSAGMARAMADQWGSYIEEHYA